MSAHVTAEQIQDLWEGHIREIDRGDELGTVTKDDLDALMDSSGIDADDTTDDGDPADHMWEILAGSLNANVPGEPTSSAQATTLQDVGEARAQLDKAHAEIEALKERLGIEDLEARLHETIRRAMATKAPRQAIADEAGLSLPRLYQIRDGRR